MPDIELEIDLEIGGVLQIDDYLLTVVEIEGDEVVFRLTQPENEAGHLVRISRGTSPR